MYTLFQLPTPIASRSVVCVFLFRFSDDIVLAQCYISGI